MRRFRSRDATLYLLLLLTVFFTFFALQQMDRADSPTYSQIRTYFAQERVKSFSLEDHTMTLTLRGPGDSTSTVVYSVADPMYLYLDLHEEWDRQLAAGTLESSDFPPGVESAWW